MDDTLFSTPHDMVLFDFIHKTSGKRILKFYFLSEQNEHNFLDKEKVA